MDSEAKSVLRFVGITAASVAALIIVFGSAFTINERERGVMTRNGKYVGVASPGINFKLPIVSDVNRISLGTNKLDLPRISAGSGDQQEAFIRASVNWRANPERVAEIFQRFGNVETGAEAIIKPRAESRLKVVFGGFTAARTFSERGSLNAQWGEDLQANVGDLFLIEGVQIEDVDFDDKYTSSISERMVAEVEVSKRLQELAKEKITAEIQNTRAKAEAYQIETKALAEAKGIEAKGNADAKSIRLKSDALANNPNLIELTKAERWGGVLPGIMLGSGTNSSPIPILQLNNASNGAAGAVIAGR